MSEIEERAAGPTGVGAVIEERATWALAVFALCLVMYTVVLIVVPRFYGTTTADGDEPSYLLMAQSLIDDGDLFLENNSNPGYYKQYYEREITLWPWVPVKGGHLASTHPPFLSLVVLPGFWLFGYKGAAFTMMLLFSIGAALTFAVADRFVKRKIAFAVTSFLFLTYPLLFYSRKVYPDTAVVFALSLGIWSTWRFKETGKKSFAAAAGLSAGLVCLFHPKYFAISLSLLFLMFLVARWDWRPYLWWLVPAALCLALLFFLTYLGFGWNLLRGVTATAGGNLIEGYSSGHEGWGVAGLFLDRSSGLFLLAPVYLLFPIGLSLQNNRSEWTRWWLFFPVCVISQVLVAGVFQSWHGGFAMIPRYLVSLAPIMVVSVALFFDRCRSAFTYSAGGVLAALQVLVTIGVFSFPMGTYASLSGGEIFLRHFLGHTWLKDMVIHAFPRLRSEEPGSLFVVAVWVLLFAVAIYLARRRYMRKGGLTASPVFDIRPFEHADRKPEASAEKGKPGLVARA